MKKLEELSYLELVELREHIVSQIQNWNKYKASGSVVSLWAMRLRLVEAMVAAYSRYMFGDSEEMDKAILEFENNNPDYEEKMPRNDADWMQDATPRNNGNKEA